MASPVAVPIWERFIASKLTQTATAAAEHGSTQSNANLTAGSIALYASADTAELIRDLAIKPTSELFSAKASRELATRGRFVEFVRAVMSCATLTNSSKKAEVAVRCVEVRCMMYMGIADSTVYRVLYSAAGTGTVYCTVLLPAARFKCAG